MKYNSRSKTFWLSLCRTWNNSLTSTLLLKSRKIKNSSALFCDRSGNDSRISSELKSTCGFAEHLDPLYSKINSKIKHQNTED